jgi:peptide/nickel transport system substrate-binding protein
VGIKLDLKITAMQEFQASSRRGENQIMMSSANYTTGDPGHALYLFDTRNFAGSLICPNDPKMDTMLDTGARTFDDTERAAAYQVLQDYIHDNTWIVPIADKKITYVTSSKVENFPCDPGNTPYLADIVVYE